MNGPFYLPTYSKIHQKCQEYADNVVWISLSFTTQSQQINKKFKIFKNKIFKFPANPILKEHSSAMTFSAAVAQCQYKLYERRATL